MKTDHVMENYGKATVKIQEMISLIRNGEAPEIPVIDAKNKVEFTCNVSKEEYCKVVEKTKEYIVDGDIFQAVISRQFTSPYEGSLMNPYRVLRTTNPSPYMVYMNIDGEEIMSASPETLVRLKDGRLTTFPVAGSGRIHDIYEPCLCLRHGAFYEACGRVWNLWCDRTGCPV